VPTYSQKEKKMKRAIEASGKKGEKCTF